MKKLLLSLCLALVSIFSFSIPKTSALDPIPPDPNSLWEVVSFVDGGTTYYYLSLHLEFEPYSVSEIEITIPDTYFYAVDAHDTYTSYFRFAVGGSTLDSELTSAFTDLLADGGIVTFNLVSETYTYMASTVAMTDIWQSTDFYIAIYLDFHAIPGGNTAASYAEKWSRYSAVTLTADYLEIAFFSQLKYVSSYFVGPESDVDTSAFELPPIPTGYQFLCWRTKTGDQFISGPVSNLDPDWLTEIDGRSVLYLYAAFVDESGDEYEYLPPSGGAPANLDAIFAAIGWANDTGYFIVFTVIVFLATVILLLFKLPPFVVMIVDGALAFLFFFLGWIPLFSFIIVLLIIALGIFFSLNRGGVTNE